MPRRDARQRSKKETADCSALSQRVFAQIKPATNTRIDLGFCFKDYKGRLPKGVIDTGGLAKKDHITHRIELKSASEIDDQVKKLLKTAYDLDR